MIARWSAGSADGGMPQEILTELKGAIDRHPWWRARAALTLALLGRLGVRPPARVLDAGCGWGTTLEALEGAGYRGVGADVSRRALEAIDRPGRTLAEFDLAAPLPDEAGVGTFDAVLALDVIEHLDDDRGAVDRLGALARPGGVVVVSVPALPDLFAEFDAIQGHRRRYLPGTLRSAFEGTGLELERVFWWGSWLVPMLRRSRGRSRARPGDSAADVYRRHLRVPPWPAPLLFRAAFGLEQGLALDGRLGVGTSLFAVARRPGEGHRQRSSKKPLARTSSGSPTRITA